MRVVDTSAWLEWLMASPIADRVRSHLPEREQWLVPTIVQLELAKWLAREVSDEAAREAVAFSQLCAVAPLTTSIAVAAADLCRKSALSTVDAVIYATAEEFDADLVTCDGHFSSLPRTILVEKTAERH